MSEYGNKRIDKRIISEIAGLNSFYKTHRLRYALATDILVNSETIRCNGTIKFFSRQILRLDKRLLPSQFTDSLIMKKKRINIFWIIIVGVIVFIILIISFGNFDFTDTKTKKTKPSVDELKERHKRLFLKIIQEEKLYKKLRKTFNFIYFIVRLFFLLIFAGYNLILYIIFNIRELGDFMDYTEVLIIVILAFLFLFFKKPSNLVELIKLIEIKIETWIYRKYITLPEQIMVDKNELKEINKQLNDN